MSYPVAVELNAPPEVANWRPLVHWLLAVPHTLIAGVLGYVASVVALVSWFIIVFTGKLPAGIAGFQSLMLRYSARANTYSFWLYEDYPPFEFESTTSDPGTSPLRVDIDAALENRNRLTVALRFFWIIPVALFLAVVGIVAWFAMVGAFFAVLFTGRWPEGLRTFMVGVTRLSMRVSAYGYLLVDEYPPFSLEP